MPLRRRLAWIAVALFVVAFAAFVWPTPWSYDAFAISGGVGMLRRNRLTNGVEMIHATSTGWEAIGDAPPP